MKQSSKNPKVFIALLLFANFLHVFPAEGAQWVKAGTLDGDPVYLDKETIERGPGSAVRAWIRCRVSRYVLIGDKFLDTFFIHYEFDCGGQTSRNLETVLVYKDGTGDRVQTPGFSKDVTMNTSQIHQLLCP